MPIDYTRLIDHPRVAVINDLHIGDPSESSTDQFDGDEAFEWLLSDGLVERAGEPVSLVINGDFLDFTQVRPACWRSIERRHLGTTETESVEKLERIAAGHPRVFTALADFLDRGNQVLLMAGNHDVDFYWPEVLRSFRQSLGAIGHSRLAFVPTGYLYERRLYIEHGHQYSRDNCFQHWPNPIHLAPDGPRLERPWGSLFMEHVYRSIPELHPYVYRLLPRRRLTQVLIRSLADGDRISRTIWRSLAPFLMETGWGPLGKWLGKPSGARKWQARQRSLDADVHVLAHTHLPRAEAIQRERGDERSIRVFNTGSWIASYPLDESTTKHASRWHWSDLKRIPLIAEPRCLMLEWRGDRWLSRTITARPNAPTPIEAEQPCASGRF